mmetsp:Transcript_78126/g.210289  ORF Transcript_78126/g.210289 Transcript_78126/m.210289 type:complete len:88 (-) Transcript_78126:103-366(-)
MMSKLLKWTVFLFLIFLWVEVVSSNASTPRSLDLRGAPASPAKTCPVDTHVEPVAHSRLSTKKILSAIVRLAIPNPKNPKGNYQYYF